MREHDGRSGDLLPLTRRDLLGPVASGGLAVAAGALAWPGRLPATAQEGPAMAAHLPAGLSAFPLRDVPLSDGPFLRAQQRLAAYLLSLDPDRRLHGLRANAGLPPRAPVHGGWGSAPTWADIHCQGHTLGHHLSA